MERDSYGSHTLRRLTAFNNKPTPLNKARRQRQVPSSAMEYEDAKQPEAGRVANDSRSEDHIKYEFEPCPYKPDWLTPRPLDPLS